MKTEIIRINLKEHVDERVAWVGEEALRLAMALCITATTYAGEHLWYSSAKVYLRSTLEKEGNQ